MKLTGEQFWRLKYLVSQARNSEFAERTAADRAQNDGAAVGRYLSELGLDPQKPYTLNESTLEAVERTGEPPTPAEPEA